MCVACRAQDSAGVAAHTLQQQGRAPSSKAERLKEAKRRNAAAAPPQQYRRVRRAQQRTFFDSCFSGSAAGLGTAAAAGAASSCASSAEQRKVRSTAQHSHARAVRHSMVHSVRAWTKDGTHNSQELRQKQKNETAQACYLQRELSWGLETAGGWRPGGRSLPYYEPSFCSSRCQLREGGPRENPRASNRAMRKQQAVPRQDYHKRNTPDWPGRASSAKLALPAAGSTQWKQQHQNAKLGIRHTLHATHTHHQRDGQPRLTTQIL